VRRESKLTNPKEITKKVSKRAIWTPLGGHPGAFRGDQPKKERGNKREVGGGGGAGRKGGEGMKGRVGVE